MRKALKNLCLLSLLFTIACSSLDRFDGSEASFTYQDFEQRAPASLTPVFKDDGTLDSFHMKSQADYYFTMAEAYSLEGEVDRAIDSYKLTLVYDQSAYEVRVKLAAEFLKKGYVSEAIEQAELAVKEKPDLISAHFLLAGIYTSLKIFDKAIKKYKTVISLDSENEEAHLYLGAIYVEEQKWQEAIKAFDFVANNKEGRARYLGYFYQAKVQEALENKNKARKLYEKALENKPNFKDGVLALGKSYESESREKAKRFYKSYLEKYGANVEVHELLGSLYLDDEEYGNALKQFLAVERIANTISARIKIAMIYIERKDYDNAIQRLQSVLIEVPESDKIRFYLAAVYEETQDLNNAIDMYKQIPVASSYYVDASVHGIYLLKKLGKTESALEWNKEALKKRPSVLQFYTLYASLLDDKKDYKSALSFLNEAEKSFPDNEQIQYFLGSFLDKLGDNESSKKKMRLVLKRNPRHSQAMNFLAYVLAEEGNNLDEAEAFALQALQLKPQDAYYLDTLGWVYYKKGEIDKAIQYLEVAHKIKPEESIIAQHLGDAYYQYRLPKKAKVLYSHALQYEEDIDERDKIQKKLASTQDALSLPAANKATEIQFSERKPASVND